MRASIFTRRAHHCGGRFISAAAIAVTLVVLGSGVAFGQDKPTLTPEEYGRWENLGRATLSPDGAWVAYEVRRVDEEAELRIRSLQRDSVRSVSWGRSPAFTPDGRWLAWAVGVSPEEEERLEEAEEPVRLGLGLLDLTNGEERGFQEVRAFEFDSSGRFLALHGYPPEEPKGKGADLRVVDLAAGSTTTFGNVDEFSWSDSASMLALAVSTGGEEGNGVQVYEPGSGRIRSLGTSGSAYRQLAWREGAADLAALRSREPASEEAATAHDVLAWRGLDGGEVVELVLTAETAGLVDTLEVVRHAAPAWSDDGRMISIGLRPIPPDDPEEKGPGDETGEEAGTGDEGPEDVEGDSPQDSTAAEEEEPELPGLQIWHSSDRRIFARQQASQDSDERRTLLAVWHLDGERVVQLGTDLQSSVELLEGWTRAIEETQEPYAWGEMFGRPYNDTWVIDVATGERERVLERVRYSWASAGGRWLVAFDGANYSSLDMETGARYDLTSGLPTVFADTAHDTPTDVLPPHGFGPGGWLEGDEAVFLYDEHDVWRVAPDGSEAARLTRGLEEDITHRLVREFDPGRGGFRTLGEDDDEPGLDPTRSIYLSLYGERSERRGYARVMPAGAGGGQGDEPTVERLVFDDKWLGGLTKADSADVYLFSAQAFDDPPDLFAAGPDLSDARQLTSINPFITEYAWGRAELVDFVSDGGRDLQAVLLYPANYQSGERVPMIVYTYEMLSPQIHLFSAPSERRYYSFTAWTQQGYAVLLPDIVYRARDPGISALESVRAAVARIVEMGVADAERVGLIGHSWGGYQATFLPTRTDIFAASVAGAPLTDFVSFMGAIHWNPGVPEVDHWETGQARMEVPFWDDPEAHRRNSPIHKVHEMETPLLMAFGNEDGVVDWDQGTEFYNFARRAGKQMVLLVYEGEDHGFRQKANQVDYHRRILEWFGHYLKGEPAPAWITEGIPLDELENEARRVARVKGVP